MSECPVCKQECTADRDARVANARTGCNHSHCRHCGQVIGPVLERGHLSPAYHCAEHGIRPSRCDCPADAKREGSGALKVHEYLVTCANTWYHAGTDPKVIEELGRAHNSRVRIWLGDKETGKDWLEENDVTGTIGRSMGPIRIPLLIANSRSLGGGGILTDCIVRLAVDGREVYRHPKYVEPKFEITPSDMQPEYEVNVDVDGQTHARFRTRAKAERWVAFMTGKRMAK